MRGFLLAALTRRGLETTSAIRRGRSAGLFMTVVA